MTTTLDDAKIPWVGFNLVKGIGPIPAEGLNYGALDLACGTGDITYALRDARADSVGLDITARMVEIARGKRSSGSPPPFLVGDMMALPFGDATFDLVTTGYGIRNVPMIDKAFAEIRRVLRPGGMLLSLDFDRPSNPVVRGVYLAYLTLVGSMLGLVLHGDPDTYRYIPESIRRYPGGEAVCAIAREQGFAACDRVPVLGGLNTPRRSRSFSPRSRPNTPPRCLRNCLRISRPSA